MEGLASIVGQPRAVGRLRAALSTGKAHHAYLFEGPEGIGKRTCALALAQAWNCEVRPGEGCGQCGACRKIDAGTHPDVVNLEVFDDEGKVKGQVDRVRALLAALGFPPHEGRARLVLIDPADELNQFASNALLKTLEEPPRDTHFILVTAAASRMLTTIRSRCQRLAFSPLPDAVVMRALVAEHGIAEDAAQYAASLAGGSLGRALLLASSDDLPKRVERVSRLLNAAHSRAARDLIDAAAELSGDREEALATLETLWVTYHDAVVIAAGSAVAATGQAQAGKLAERVATPSLLGALHAVEEAASAVRGYVAPQLAVERMLLRIAHVRGA